MPFYQFTDIFSNCSFLLGLSYPFVHGKIPQQIGSLLAKEKYGIPLSFVELFLFSRWRCKNSMNRKLNKCVKTCVKINIS